MMPLRVGLIGAGGISASHLKAYRDHPDRVELVAVCDIVESAARSRADQLGIERVYTDADEMLRDAPIDAVDICTIPSEHARIAIAAAESGKHVLVEKPMAGSMAECVAMVEAAERAGVTLMVAQSMRFMPCYRRARDEIAAGAIGRVRAVQLDLMIDIPRLYPQKDHWLYDAKRALGGVVINGGVHPIDLVRYLVGEATSVSATCWTARSDWFPEDVEDYAVATLALKDGAVCQFFGSFSALAPPWGWAVTIVGDEGMIANLPADADHPAGSSLLTKAAPGRDQPDRIVLGEASGDEGARSFVDEILHFAECCATGAEPLTGGRDNLRTMEQIFAIYESSRTGRDVRLTTGA